MQSMCNRLSLPGSSMKAAAEAVATRCLRRVQILGWSMAACLALGGLALSAEASVTFFVHPDGNLVSPPADATLDAGFQAALTPPQDGRLAFTEFDFAGFGHAYIMEPSPLFTGPTKTEWAGGVRVRPNLLDVNGNNAADLGINGNRLIETYPHIPAVPGILDGPALLNRTYAGNFADVTGAAVEFTFSEPVRGFGTWIMDDIVEPSRFVLKVTEVGGATFISSPLESGNGTNLAIEGFLGAVSDAGIIRVVVEQQTLEGTPSNADFFYLDHVQVGRRWPQESSCNDGLDNNGNSLTDCVDPDCFDSLQCEEVCDDGIDNTGNGLADCYDPQCWQASVCMNLDHEVCGNGIDNDGDGLIDCYDPDCFGPPYCTAEICGDGQDNDANCLVDGADPQCTQGQVIVYVSPQDTALDGPVYGAGGMYVEPTWPLSWAGSFTGEVAWAVSKFDLSEFLPVGTTSANIAWAAASVPQTDVSWPNHGQPWTLDLVLHHFETTDNTSIVSADHHTITPALTDFGVVLPAHLPAVNPLARRTVDVTSAIKSDLDNGRTLSSFRLGANPAGPQLAAELTYLANADNTDVAFGQGPADTRNTLRVFIQLAGQGEYDCTDGIDNDGNGQIDCADGGCMNHPACWPRELCNDGVDNNFNGLVDCEDPQCASSICCDSGPCNRPGMDVDGDTDVDMEDFAALQRCLGSGSQQSLELPCLCFDSNGDGVIDADDVLAFVKCGSGSGVPAEPGCAD